MGQPSNQPAIFPYSGKTIFSNPNDADPNVVALMSAHSAVESILLGLLNIDPNIKILAHFEGALSSQVGSPAASNGAVRYWAGKYGTGVVVEGGGSNLVPNPSAEIDVTGWLPVDGSVSLLRDPSQFYNGNGTVSVASFKIAGTNNAGVSYISSNVTVQAGLTFSASVYVYAPPGSNSQAKLQLAFSGGTPVSYDSGNVPLTAGGWTRLRVEGSNSNNNNTAAIRVYLTQQAPAFVSGSRLSTLSPTATAGVSDNAMTINAGDLCMCAATANPPGPLNHAWHMVTTGATGVAGAALRLDDNGAAPTFVGGTQFSKLAPAGGDSVLVTDALLALNAGDYVFCNLSNVGYAWHLVTTGATGANNAALRLDDGPSAPSYVPGSRLTRIVATATAAVTDNAMIINAGDMVFCRVITNPAPAPGSGPAYAWHVVTTGATGVNSASLRLDNAPSAPSFATGSRFSKKTASASGTDTDMAATLNSGDFALALPTKNPAASVYGWHMVTTGATGVANSSLRLDQASSETIWADVVQLEVGSAATSFIDSFQGNGYSGAVGSPTARTASSLNFPTNTGPAITNTLTAACWMYPLWNASDGGEHTLFDLATSDSLNRIKLTKDVNNNLVLSVYDGNGGLKELTTNSPVSFSRETWQHLAFTINAGTMALYLNGAALSATSSGSGSGQINNMAPALYLGSDYKGNITQGAVFDDLIVSTTALTADAISKIATDTAQYLGVSAARKGFDIGHGNATSSGSAGTQTAVAHGLGVMPAFVEISERGNGIVYLSAPADSTSFYVTASANSINFDWRAYA